MPKIFTTNNLNDEGLNWIIQFLQVLWFFCSDGENRACFLIVWIQIQFVDDTKYSLSSPRSQINLINQKLLSCCSRATFFIKFFHARLNNYYEEWSYKEKEKMILQRKTVQKKLKEKRSLLTLDLKPFISLVKGKHSPSKQFQSLFIRRKKLFTQKYL